MRAKGPGRATNKSLRPISIAPCATENYERHYLHHFFYVLSLTSPHLSEGYRQLGIVSSRLVADLFTALLASFNFILLIRRARVVPLKKRNKLRAFNILASLQAGPQVQGLLNALNMCYVFAFYRN